MSAGNKQYVILELVKELTWWLISIVIAAAVMYPLTSKLYYKEMWTNGALLLIAITYFRYAIFLKTIYVLRSKWIRLALVIFNVNFFVFVLRRMQGFMYIYDSFSLDAMGTPKRTLRPEEIDPLFRYFFDEINFTCVACMVMAVALTLRIIGAHWGTAHGRLNAGTED